MDFGHWKFDKDFDVDEWFGFIYRIIDKSTNQHYIGKKQFHQHLRKVVKGRKNRKKVTKESNWKTYCSSSVHLQKAIEEKGKENFIFLIESLHKSKGSLTYAEVKKQVQENVLLEKLSNGTPKYLNKQIAAIKFIPPDVLPDEETMILSEMFRNDTLEKL